MKHILDPSFKYVPASKTDIRKTFARIKREQKLAREQEDQDKAAIKSIFAIRRAAK